MRSISNLNLLSFLACSIITAIGRPVTHGKSSTMFGAWMRDPADGGKGPVWVMRHFFDNRIVEEYKNMRDVARWRPRATHKLPYEWAGHKVTDIFTATKNRNNQQLNLQSALMQHFIVVMYCGSKLSLSQDLA